MRVLLAVLMLAFLAFGQTTNWNGYSDTAQVAGFRSDSLKYSKVFPLTMYENMAVVVKMDDTGSTGFASDSLDFIYGYQVGYPVYNSSGTADTAWSNKVILDSVQLAKIGVIDTGRVDSTGALAWNLKTIDTSSVSGFATSISQFAPPWGVFIRFWADGTTSNKKASYIKLVFDFKRRIYANVSKGN